MTDNERDTHFQNAAELLSEKLGALYLSKGLEAILGDPNGEIKQQEITLFAQFAYDLVEHTLEQFEQQYDWGFGTLDSPLDVLQKIPDLAQWPISPDIS